MRDRDYDWEQRLRDLHGANFWSRADEEILIREWWARAVIGDLAAKLGKPERRVVKHLIDLGYANSAVEIAEQLGHVPGDVLYWALVRAHGTDQWTLTMTEPANLTHRAATTATVLCPDTEQAVGMVAELMEAMTPGARLGIYAPRPPAPVPQVRA